jgi:signal transduction histidine kinase/DNA-binding response OmpR family regulator
MGEQMAAETKANVLLVDDKPENLLALEAILADLGQNLIGATSAREALRVLLLEDVALILLDVQMPGLSGFELAELIRERERTQHTPIIFVTADNSDEEYVFKGYALGAVDYLTKPIQPEILKSKVSFFSRLFLQQQVIRQKSKELEEANESLDAMNVELEARVRQRTSDLESEVEVRRQSEARLATEHSITRSLAGAASVDKAAPDILRAFIANMNAAIAAMWELSPDGLTLQCTRVEVSAAEAASVAAFVAETRKAKFTRGIGLPGRVWEKREPIWVPNTLTGEKYPRATFAATAGLHSAMGFPITVGSELYGVIEFLTREPLTPGSELINMLDATGSEIGQFIQRKRVEEERIRLLKREKALREQAEAANRLKDEFLATVSHELRTPLNSILGWSKLVLQDMVDADAVHSALETIHRNATLQAQLIEDLLDASRLITGKLLLNLSPTQIAPVIEAAVNVVRPRAEGKNVSLDFSHDDRISVVTADQSRLQQMVLNLLTNAVKFTPDGGRVSIRTERNGDVAKIIVTDTGVGISPDFLPYVFDRFRQQDSSSTRRHDGLGLGLAIVSHLAELHGGSVTADSRGVGEGSTFVISLPLTASVDFAEPAEPETIARTTTANGLSGVRIHVVDDDEDACQMLKFALGLQGAEVETSSSAANAIAAIEERCPDILLADLNMPGEDGYSLIKKVRNLNDGKASSMPAIALTAMARTEDTERVLSAGFQLHIPKPVEIDELAASIVRLLGREPRNGNSVTA